MYLDTLAVHKILDKVGMLCAEGSIIVGDMLNEACLQSESSKTLYKEWDKWGQRPCSGFSSPEALLWSHGFAANVSVFGEPGVDYGRIPAEYKAAMAAVPRQATEHDPIPRNFVFVARRDGRSAQTVVLATEPQPSPSPPAEEATAPAQSSTPPRSKTQPTNRTPGSGSGRSATARYLHLYSSPQGVAEDAQPSEEQPSGATLEPPRVTSPLDEALVAPPTYTPPLAPQAATLHSDEPHIHHEPQADEPEDSQEELNQDRHATGMPIDSALAFRLELAALADAAEAELTHLEDFVMPGKMDNLHRLVALARRGTL